jgi:hypothetical protein
MTHRRLTNLSPRVRSRPAWIGTLGYSFVPGRIEVWQGDRMLGTLDRRAVQVELLRHMAERAAAAGKLLP